MGDIVYSPNPYNAWSIPPNNVQNFSYLDTALGSMMQAVDGGAVGRAITRCARRLHQAELDARRVAAEVGCAQDE
ncbi:MAG: hypothetical protein ACREPY_06900 [Rhodanobacteraceae bacterium]